jgi:membrane protein DedA with SNARE-associated domain
MEHLFTAVEPFVRAHGSPVVGIVLFFESLGLPLPGESMLIVAGVLASRGEISPTLLILYAWVGSVLGDNAGYVIGRLLGRQVLLRYGGRVGLTAERFARIEEVFARYGPVAVAFARFVNVLRQLNGIVAGVAGMRWERFLLFNALGAALWVGFWGGGALLFGRHIGTLEGLLHHLGPWSIAALAAAAIVSIAGIIWLARRTGPVKG